MYDTGEILSSTAIIALKNRVKAEMNRRKYTKSLTKYASSTWNYSTTPEVGADVLVEHANKIIIPLNKVRATGYNEVSQGD